MIMSNVLIDSNLFQIACIIKQINKYMFAYLSKVPIFGYVNCAASLIKTCHRLKDCKYLHSTDLKCKQSKSHNTFEMLMLEMSI